MDSNFNLALDEANLSVRPFGVAVSRVWLPPPATGKGPNEEKSNPYRFGDLPGPWAESFRRCLEGTLVAEDLYGLPDRDTLATDHFIVRGAQYGSIHISKNVSLFMDGWYSEIEPEPGQQMHACICVPTELLFEVHAFFEKSGAYEQVKVVRRGTFFKKTFSFKSARFPDIAFALRFGDFYPEISMTPTLLERGLGMDGATTSPKFDGKTIAFGEVSLSEAQTMEIFSTELQAMPVEQLSAADAYVNYVLDNGVDDCEKYPTYCGEMIYVANDIVAFVFAPHFLANVQPLQSVLPPAAIPTRALARFMRERIAAR